MQIVIDSEGRGGRPEGTVVRILEHANETLVGTYEKGKGYGFVIPDNQRISKDIFIPQGCSQGAVSGHKVMVKIRDFGEKKGKKPEGVITEILGHIHDPGVDILSIVRAYNLPEDFPGAVKNQLKQIPDEVKKDSWAGRKDLRDLPTVTIDGEEAKDLDDAISIVTTNNTATKMTRMRYSEARNALAPSAIASAISRILSVPDRKSVV